MNVLEFLHPISSEDIYGEDYCDLVDIERRIQMVGTGLTISANGLLIDPYAEDSAFPTFPYAFYAQTVNEKDVAAGFPREDRLSSQYEEPASFCCCSLAANDPVIKEEVLMRYFQMLRRVHCARCCQNGTAEKRRILLRFVEF